VYPRHYTAKTLVSRRRRVRLSWP